MQKRKYIDVKIKPSQFLQQSVNQAKQLTATSQSKTLNTSAVNAVSKEKDPVYDGFIHNFNIGKQNGNGAPL